MAFTTGVVTGHLELLVAFRTWILAQGWTELRYVAPTLGDNLSVGELCIRGPGAGADKQVFLNFQTWGNSSALAYGWDVRAAVGFNSGLTWTNQPSESGLTSFTTGSTAIQYWFYANDRRVIIVARVSTLYVSCYAGFFLPWATPDQYPLPLVVAGTNPAKVSIASTDALNRSFADPGLGALKVRFPSGVWKNGGNHNTNANINSHIGGSAPTDRVITWPYTVPLGTTLNSTIEAWITTVAGAGGQMFDRLQPTAQGDRIVMPVYLLDVSGSGLGAFDGVACPFGGGLIPEQTVVAEGRTFRAFPSLHRTSADDFMLIEEI